MVLGWGDWTHLTYAQAVHVIGFDVLMTSWCTTGTAADRAIVTRRGRGAWLSTKCHTWVRIGFVIIVLGYGEQAWSLTDMVLWSVLMPLCGVVVDCVMLSVVNRRMRWGKGREDGENIEESK